MRPVVVLGCGGHGRMVAEAWQAAGHMPPAVFLDDDRTCWGRSVDGVLVQGPIDSGFGTPETECDALIGIGAVRHPGLRVELIRRVLSRYGFPSVVHPEAVISGYADIERGSVVLAGAIVSRGAVLGAFTTVYTGAIVEHDCQIGAHSQIAPAACLAGEVTVGARCFIGMGARILQGVTVHDDAIVGAGAVVTRDVRVGLCVVGIPARPINGSSSCP